MRKTIICAAGMAAIFAGVNLLSNAMAKDGQRTSVREAAIKRLQSKLGELRGSIKKDTARIFLTENMIEQLKPITKDTASRAAALEAEQKSSVVTLSLASTVVQEFPTQSNVVELDTSDDSTEIENALQLAASNSVITVGTPINPIVTADIATEVDAEFVTGSIERPDTPDVVEEVQALPFGDTDHEDQIAGSSH